MGSEMLSPLMRNSLEEMLESLRRRNEEKKSKVLPPALPTRPTSKARLPSTRRVLPDELKAGDGGSVIGNRISKSVGSGKGEGSKRKEKGLGMKRGTFGSKKKKNDPESPYVITTTTKNDKSDRLEEPTSTTSSKSKSLQKVGESESNDDIDYFTKKKLRVWCMRPSGNWVLGTIQSTLGEEASVSLSNGNVMNVKTRKLYPANPEILEGADDLIQLSYLNEPSVLYNLRFRYSEDIIYTKAGPVLIALNPFKDLQLDKNDHISAYRQKLSDTPHVYAIADTAYTEMVRDQINQSIIISGESGAGKTETAKITMNYLATLGGGTGGIENDILQTNYILEAFGNAKTSRNDNSSRFGKLIEIHFSTLGKICGAKIQTFLLEKSRVVQLANEERSYHIFYQLCAGASSALKERLNLRMAGEYNYLNQSECIKIGGVDDSEKFRKLVRSLNVAGICKDNQECLFEVLAAILWLGNVSFKVFKNKNDVEVVAGEAVINAAKLMGCSSQELMITLSTHKIQCGKETISKKLTLRQAIDTRDALAKFMYESLFNWLVEQMNNSLEVGKQCKGRSISILDIYGFESFKRNSFEQFCINYANERLQQHFNRHLFKLEQEDYEMDGIDWTKIHFEDNQECLDLFEKKPLGLLSLLDEESNFPRATDLTFANKLKQHLHYNTCFKAERGGAFRVCHYAGEVLYDTNGFLEKNRDPLHFDSIRLLLSCSSQLLKLSVTKMLQHMGALNKQKQSVGTKFKGQLFMLMNQLEITTPHFIRCIKPNSKHLPRVYDEQLVLQQLRCCGVVDVVRTSRSRYPTRMTHKVFAERYGLLFVEANLSNDPLSISVAVLQHFNIQPEMYQVGYTKVYLRAGQIGTLENRRKQFVLGVLGIQKQFRRHKASQHLQDLRNGALVLQSFVRGEIARKKYNAIATSSLPCQTEEELQAIIQLQSVFRGNASIPSNNKVSPESAKFECEAYGKFSEGMDLSKEMNLPSDVAELQKRVLKAESALKKKVEENAALREQLKQCEKRSIDYEMKMKSMEEMRQRQMSTLQMSLAAVRKGNAAEDNNGAQHARSDFSSVPTYDSEDVIAMESRTPNASKPNKCSSRLSDSGRGDSNRTLDAVSSLANEFDRCRQAFDDEVKVLGDVQTRKTANVHSEQLGKLKSRFDAWKKDYKVRLRETKARLQKLGNSEVDKGLRKWWSKLSHGYTTKLYLCSGCESHRHSSLKLRDFGCESHRHAGH